MWLSDYARPAAATQNNYRYGAKRITARIGELRLGDVDRPVARKLGGEWPRDTMRTARTMFGDAMRDGLIEFNPFSDLRLETPRGRKDIDALTPEQIDQLATSAHRVHGDSYGVEAARSSSRSATPACALVSWAQPDVPTLTRRPAGC